MSLTLHYHPLSSYCQKVLVALYENATPFDPLLVNLGDAESRAAFLKVWPLGKFPVLQDSANGRTVAESTIIIEYLDSNYPGVTRFVPKDANLARETRMQDRFLDLYVHNPMQRIIGDRLRPADKKDAYGVDEARRTMRLAFDMIEKDLGSKTWAMGEAFTLADCAAAPALYYANLVLPFGETHKKLTAYFERLLARPSFARAVREADPYRHMFPKS